MSLQDWLREGRLHRHRTSAGEAAKLLRVVERDSADASLRQLSPDRRFATAYNAALQLATIALYAAGFRSEGAGHHWITLQALSEIVGPESQERVDYLDACRSKRNLTDYEEAGAISHGEADKLLRETLAFKSDLMNWLKANHPHLLWRPTR